MTRHDRRRSLLLAVLAFILVMIVWQIADLNVILTPFRYFVTTIHELGHGLTALISGGQFVRYEVFETGAGVATTAGGTRWLILPAGYVGTALFGAVLLYAANRTHHTRIIATGLGLLFAAFTLLFARNLTGILAGALTAAGLILIGRKGSIPLNTFVLNVLAVVTGLNAVLDLVALLRSPSMGLLSAGGGLGTPNDALAMAQTAGFLPAIGWAIVWTATALTLIGTSAYYTFWRPLRDGEV